MQVALLPALGTAGFIASLWLRRMAEQVRKAGRPGKWEDEAARKRAYRQRRAAKLSNPLELGEAARVARAEAAQPCLRRVCRPRGRAIAGEGCGGDKRAQAAERRLARSDKRTR